MNHLAYAVGALLYAPATNAELAGHVLAHDWPRLTAIAICLEDSIVDSALPMAEAQLKDTLQTLAQAQEELPLLFVRVRNPEHLRHVHAMLGAQSAMLTGYVLPKFDCKNGGAYMEAMREINAARREGTLYAMPILESGGIADVRGRAQALAQLRELIDHYRDLVLNVRVGGNDFCKLYGLRRGVHQTIYEVGVVRDILMDVLNVFSEDYVVSGPVWEYYGADPDAPWAEGLRRELELDRLNGFLGKTAIHPAQLPLIYESMQVSPDDYADAQQLLSWSDPLRAVSGGAGGRMNEVKCHTRWAERIQIRAEIYGIRGEEGRHA